MSDSDIPLRYARIWWEDGRLEWDSSEYDELGRCLVTDTREEEGEEEWPFWQTVSSISTSPYYADKQRIRALLAIFHMLVVRDNVHPRVVHRAFWKIPEYRSYTVTEDIAF